MDDQQTGDKQTDETTPRTDNVFEVDRIRELVELMKEHDLSEIDLRHKPRRIRLRRGSEAPPAVNYSLPPQMAAPVAAAPAAAGGEPAATPAETSSAAADDSNIHVVESPTVGTFYSRPKPESSDFVKVGDEVTAETIVCLVEAMKMFNEIPAGVAGTIVEVLAKNEDTVDVGRALFKIKIG